MTVTPDLRPKEAGLIELGVGATRSQVIPPNQDSFVTQGHCQAPCLDAVGTKFAQTRTVSSPRVTVKLRVSMR